MITYNCSALTGGATGALDDLSVSVLSDGDRAFTIVGEVPYYHEYDSTSTATESSPNRIRPDDYVDEGCWIGKPIGSGFGVVSGVNMSGNVVGFDITPDTDASHDVSVSAGITTDSTNTAVISMESAIVKQIDSAWSAGTGNGGMLNGSVTLNKCYKIYALLKDSDSSVDVGFLLLTDTLATYMPSGYTYARFIGFVYTDGSSDINYFNQTGNCMRFSDSYVGLAISSTLTTSFTSLDVSDMVPGEFVDSLIIGGRSSTGTNTMSVSLDGTAIADSVIIDQTGGVAALPVIPYQDNIYFKADATSVITPVILGAILKR